MGSACLILNDLLVLPGRYLKLLAKKLSFYFSFAYSNFLLIPCDQHRDLCLIINIARKSENNTTQINNPSPGKHFYQQIISKIMIFYDSFRIIQTKQKLSSLGLGMNIALYTIES